MGGFDVVGYNCRDFLGVMDKRNIDVYIRIFLTQNMDSQEIGRIGGSMATD